MGMSEELAKYQARQFEQLFDNKRVLEADARELATKCDIKEIELKIEQVTADLDAKIEKTRADLSSKIEQVRADLDAKIEQVRADLELKIEQVRVDVEKVRVEIHKSKFELVIWVAGLLLASGFIQHFFK